MDAFRRGTDCTPVLHGRRDALISGMLKKFVVRVVEELHNGEMDEERAVQALKILQDHLKDRGTPVTD